MKEYQSLAHTKWDCKYHVVFIPKKRKKAIFGVIRKHLGSVLHELANQKDCKILEGHLMSDHMHMCISIPPKYSVSNVVGYIKGKSAISIARRFMGKSRNFAGESFGPEAISFQQLVWTKKWSEPISESKKKKMNIMIN